MKPVVRALVCLAVLMAAACMGVGTSAPVATSGFGQPVSIQTRRVPLSLAGGLDVAGADLAPGVRYVGGVSIYGMALHGLSDLKLEGDHAWAVSDFGDLLRFTMTLDGRGRLVGAANARSLKLSGPDGRSLPSKEDADAEGLAILDDGRLIVSFERDDRIWSYGSVAADQPTVLHRPEVDFPDNQGMEGLSAAPGGWLVLGEEGGAWVCDPAACRALPGAPTRLTDGYRFTSADRDPAGGWFVTLRKYIPPLDMRVQVRHMAPDGTLGPVLIALRPPASVDNFEGIAVKATPAGTRLYLLSDDNANPLQKTLLMAFDLVY